MQGQSIAVPGPAPTQTPIPTRTIAAIACRIVASLLLANVVIDLALRLSGRNLSFNSVIPFGDLFADYFGFVVSLPGGEHISSRFAWLAERLHAHQGLHRLGPLAELAAGANNHFAAPPLNILFGLASAQAMQRIEPALLYTALWLSLLGYWGRIVVRFVPADAMRPSLDRWAIGLLGLCSCPMLMILVRGNVYAGLAGLLIVHALLLALDGGSARRAALLLAVAVILRPNAVVFAVPLFALARDRRTVAITLAFAIPAIFATAMLAAHRLYPLYGWETFRAGVQCYYATYVRQGYGLAFGSSMFGGLSYLFGNRPGLTTLALLPAGAVGLGAMLLHWRGRIAVAPYLFLICAAYTLGSTVIADYHLLVFLLPVIVLARQTRPDALSPSERVVLVASCLMLAPKNYGYDGDVSLQPLLNPATLLIASTMVAWTALHRGTGIAGLLPGWSWHPHWRHGGLASRAPSP